MDHAPRRRIVQRALMECLARTRRFGETTEDEFARAVADLPGVLRELAAALDNPPPDLARRCEAPGLEGYSLWADSYDSEMDNPVVLGEETRIHDIIGPPRGLRVLDVGCGTGRHALRLASQGADVLGIDPTPEMLDRARAKAKARGVDVRLEAGDIAHLPDGPGLFDLVLCCLVLSHVADLREAVGRLTARVTPGGRLIITDFHPVNLLLGLRTAFSHDGQPYIVPNHLHSVADYFGALRLGGLAVTRLCELGEWPTLPGVPATLLLEGTRPLPGTEVACEPTVGRVP